MIVLYNPTDEDFDMQYGGVSMTMEAGTKSEVEDACGNHLLNSYGQRGLTRLFYDCDEVKISKDGRNRNREFKKKQVVEYNQRNEQRKTTGLPFLPPTGKVKEYAIFLGLQLLEPYSLKDEEKSAISETREENKLLRTELNELKKMMKTLMDAKPVDGRTREAREAKGK